MTLTAESTEQSSLKFLSLFEPASKQRSRESKDRLLRLNVAAIDTETTGLDTYSPRVRLTHVSYWTNKGRGRSYPVDHEELSRVKRIAESPDWTKLFFNAKFDMRMLAKRGIIVRGPIIDVRLQANLLLPEERAKKLKHLARKFLKEPFLEAIKMKQWLKENKGKTIGDAPDHIVQPYNLADSRMTLELFYFFMHGIDKYNLWAVIEREMLLMRKVVMPMEDHGAMLDLPEVDKMRVKVRTATASLKTKLLEMTGNPKFNPNSHDQVAKAVYNGTVMPTHFTKTGKPQVNVVALLDSPSEIGSLVVEYRKLSKAGSTYLKNFDRKILHVDFNPGGAKTGRFSSSGPNLQNIPRPKEDNLLGQMRRLFVARPGNTMFFCDYSQIEMRLAAHFSGETHMLEAINAGVDLHDTTCKVVFNLNPNSPDWEIMRYLAKTFNFSILYGAGANQVRETILKQTNGKIRFTQWEVSRRLDTWKEKHPAIMRMFDNVAVEIAKFGGVMNNYGRFIPADSSKSYVGVNYKIQGTAADFMKMKMMQVAMFLKQKETRLFLTIHDELVFDMPRHEAKLARDIVRLMEDHTTYSVPLTCGVAYGPNWFNKKKLTL